MRKAAVRGLLLAVLGCGPAVAAESTGAADAEKERIRMIVQEVVREYAASLGSKQAPPGARAVLQNVVQDNQKFMRSHKPDYFKPFADGQHPRATVVTCADSRVHSHAFDATPDGDLFMIRNIGNQIATAEGSVEYGVRHLRTPVLLVVGHSSCGAIKAAAGDYSRESGPIRRELDTLQVPKGEGGMSGVLLNVHKQVSRAMAKFEPEVLSGALTVVGAVYDFRGELKQGQGKLAIVNVNGETDPKRIAMLEIMQDLDAPPAKSTGRKKNRY